MQYAKAIVAGLIAGLGTAAAAITDGHITLAEGIAIASALVAGYGTWLVPPNGPGTRSDNAT
jgi:hypothetical protein